MKASRGIRQKLARLEAGGRPRVLDVFSGCTARTFPDAPTWFFPADGQ